MRSRQAPARPSRRFESPERGLYGIQFHPEVVHTPYGTEVLERFLREIVGCNERWSPASVIEEQVAKIRAQVGEAEVICGLSGGVDSATAAALVHKAIGEQLTCVLVDHGLMRKGECEQVVKAFREELGIKLIHVEAEERFLTRLAGETDPETKRKIIGSEFIRVFEDEARKLSDAKFLVQGTLYSDVIESGGEGHGAATIKSHHNVGGLPDDLEFDLVEPLRMLFKDEVRAVASELGLADKLVWRQPFPGPGLGIRIVGGEVNKERLDILRDADAILQEEIRAAGMYRELWQSFCVLPVVRSVGVQGDGRTYAYPIVIRAVTSEDAMTADWARLPYDLLERISNRIINEVPGVNRVALDITRSRRRRSSGSSAGRRQLELHGGRWQAPADVLGLFGRQNDSERSTPRPLDLVIGADGVALGDLGGSHLTKRTSSREGTFVGYPWPSAGGSPLSISAADPRGSVSSRHASMNGPASSCRYIALTLAQTRSPSIGVRLGMSDARRAPRPRGGASNSWGASNSKKYAGISGWRSTKALSATAMRRILRFQNSRSISWRCSARAAEL